MGEKDKRRRLTARQGMRLVLISGDGRSAQTSIPPVRIIDSEPRMPGGFRLTDR